MPSTDRQPQDDPLLIRYLLGLLSDDESVQFDERSIVDGEFAWQLKAAENDLVDSYVTGGLSGETLERFQSVYLSSPAHRQKVQFAESLLLNGARTARPQTVTPGELRPASPRLWQRFTFPPRKLAWGLACFASVASLIAGGLFWQVVTLRRHLSQKDNESSNLAQQVQSLKTRMDGLLATQAPASEGGSGRKLLSFVLPAQTRGLGPLPIVTIPAESNILDLELELETDDFPAYQAVLKDLSSNQVIRHSSGLKAHQRGEHRVVSFATDSSGLNPRNYMVELSGMPRSSEPEFVAGYPFRVAPSR